MMTRFLIFYLSRLSRFASERFFVLSPRAEFPALATNRNPSSVSSGSIAVISGNRDAINFA